MSRAAALAFALSVVAAPAVARAGAPDTIVVHVESPRPVLVQRRDDDAWEDMCRSPCDMALPRDAEYRVVAQEGRPSATFRLRGSPDDRVVLRVDPFGGERRTAGGILAVFGGVSMGVGLIALVASTTAGITFTFSTCADQPDRAAVASCQAQQGRQTAQTENKNATLGAVLAAAGVLSLVGGLALRANDATGVQQVVAAPLTPPPAPDRFVGAGWSAPKPRVEATVLSVSF